jgi:hypothetical protein
MFLGDFRDKLALSGISLSHPLSLQKVQNVSLLDLSLGGKAYQPEVALCEGPNQILQGTPPFMQQHFCKSYIADDMW